MKIQSLVTKAEIVAIILAGLLLTGCADSSAPSVATAPKTTGSGASSSVARDTKEASEPSASAPNEPGSIGLSPQNTKIVFVGTHVGEKPDPRTGGFQKFTGRAKVDASAKSLTSVSIDIETDSVSTELPMLTNHLKSADFFDVREHPKATFQSTSIESADATSGTVTILGQLTLHGVTKEISFPATVSVSDGALTLSSEFTIDRTEFGMTFGADKVEKSVAMTVTINQESEVK